MRTLQTFALLLLLALNALPAPAPKAARSVHLQYTAPESLVFYNEMVVEQSVNGSYFMACGWDTGYFGIQQQGSATNKVVIFSVWDPTKGNNPNAVKAEDRVEVLFEGEGVKIKRFGGEGTGGQCMAPFAWAIGATNRFALAVEPQANASAYTAWVYRPERGDWWKLATFRTRTGGRPLRGLYSFVEDFRRDTKSALEVRRARFANTWIKPVSGDWTAVTRARFTASGAEWEAKDTIAAGVTGSGFFLATGGETHGDVALRATMDLPGKPAQTPSLPFLAPAKGRP